MIQNLKKFNSSGVSIPLKLDENYFDPHKGISQEVLKKFFTGQKDGLSWEYNRKEVILQDKFVSIQGFPSTNLDFMIAVYRGLNGECRPPNNAVIFNLDGAVYKILEIPKLISNNITKILAFTKEPNPPLKAAISEGGLQFDGFGWTKNNRGELINSITILFDREWWESRALNPETGEIGDLVASGRL